MKCDICNGEIHDIGVRGSLPELHWKGHTFLSKEFIVCLDCASLFYEGLKESCSEPQVIPSYTLTDRRANIIKRNYKGEIIE